MADIKVPDTFLWITEADVCDLIDLSGSAQALEKGLVAGPHDGHFIGVLRRAPFGGDRAERGGAHLAQGKGLDDGGDLAVF